MEMFVELNAHAWYLIFWDLSLDTVHSSLGLMGLDRPEDIGFTKSLAPVLDRYAEMPDDVRNEAAAVTQILQLAQQYGAEYPARLVDWSQLIYPNDSGRQQQVFRWRAAVMRGAMQPGNGAPRIVEETRALLRTFVPVIATSIKPASDRDNLYCLDKGDEGISPFEWVEAAVRTYRFLYTWNSVVDRGCTTVELDQVYSWALREADLLRFPRGGLDRPEEALILPASLKTS